MLFYLFTELLAVSYLFLIFVFIYGWRRTPYYRNSSELTKDCRIAVVIAFRNEEASIGALLNILSRQSYPEFDLIMVDDHSTDKSCDVINSFREKFQSIKLIHADESGKKAALKEGILAANAELILTIDADCIPGDQWVETMLHFYTDHEPDMIIGAVRYTDSQHMFGRLQQMEFATLVGSAAGAAGAGMPIMCNGANLAFKREEWLNSLCDLHPEIASGDDMFLLQSFKKKKAKIRFLKSEKALVQTQAATTFGSFLKQRTRWSGKSNAYSDREIIFTGLTVAAISITEFGLIILSIFNISFLLGFIVLFLLKLVADIIFFKQIHSFLKLPFSWLLFSFLSLLYPFYVTVVLILSVFNPKKNW